MQRLSLCLSDKKKGFGNVKKNMGIHHIYEHQLFALVGSPLTIKASFCMYFFNLERSPLSTSVSVLFCCAAREDDSVSNWKTPSMEPKKSGDKTCAASNVTRAHAEKASLRKVRKQTKACLL